MGGFRYFRPVSLIFLLLILTGASRAQTSAVIIVSPANGATVSGTVSIVTQVQSPPVVWENIYIDGNYFKSSPPYTFSWNTTSVANGTHTIRADGRDNSGLVGTASITVTVQNGTSPTPTPTSIPTVTPSKTPTSTPAPTPAPSGAVTITSPSNGATVSGTVSIVTQVQSPPVVWENVYIDGNYFKSSPPYTFSWNSTTVANGTHTIRADGRDNSGVVGTASITVTVQNGTSPSPTPTPKPTATPSKTATPTPTPTPVASGAVSISAPISGATVSGTVSIVTQVQSPPVVWENVYIDGNYLKSSPPYTFSWDSTTVANGTHTIRADGRDTSGVVGTASVMVTVKNGTGPTPTPTAVPTSTPTPGTGTTTPIRHLILIIGENHSFDNMFGTYQPKSGQTVSSLLSKGIVTTSGNPGPNFSIAAQHTADDLSAYSINPTKTGAYSVLPQPNTTYASGQPQYVPDTRFPTNMPDGPFQITKYVSYDDAYVGDPVHRFFQMWQQSDKGAMDLYLWVAMTVGWGPDSSPVPSPGNTYQGALSMGYYNMAAGDEPHFKFMADNYALSDNMHQPIMGGSDANIYWMLHSDVLYANSGCSPTVPASDLIENTNAQSGTNNFYINEGPGGGSYVKCADTTQPGVAPIMSYINSLPYSPFRGGNCAANTYYLVNNTPSNTNTPSGCALGITTALTNKGISNKFYGAEFATGVMADEVLTDIADNTLPAVSIVGPDSGNSGQPAASTVYNLENFTTEVINAVYNEPSLWANTAILFVPDESGGYYDSGYIQPIDFFGDGPRVPFLVVSPYAKEGFVDHTYYDFSSISKFIEKNWRLSPLSARTRDNLPNPTASSDPYVPGNRPAIGDLMNMFDFSALRTDAPSIQ